MRTFSEELAWVIEQRFGLQHMQAMIDLPSYPPIPLNGKRFAFATSSPSLSLSLSLSIHPPTHPPTHNSLELVTNLLPFYGFFSPAHYLICVQYGLG
jgi:hypothetical protein